MTETSPPAADPAPRPEPRRGHLLGPRAPGAYLPLTLGARFALALTVTIVLLVAMVLFVDHHNTNAPTLMNFGSERRANQEAELLTEQDEAPHTTRLAAAATAAGALEAVLATHVRRQVSDGLVDGPVHDSQCRPWGTGSGPRRAFTCTVGAGDIKFAFVGVVDASRRQVTWCKDDPPPVPGDRVPFSPLCSP